MTPSSSGGAITFNFANCEATQMPVWFAAQSGSGPWIRITPTNNAFTFTIGATGAYALVTKDGTATETDVLYGSASEIAAIAIANPCGMNPPTGTKTIRGTLANTGLVDQGVVAKVLVGGAEFKKLDNFTQAFTLSNAPQGPRDLIAIRTQNGNPQTGKMILRRGTNYNNNESIPLLDLAGAESFITKVGGVTISNLGTDQVTLDASLVTTTGWTAPHYSISGPAPASQRIPFIGLPDTLLRAGDFHAVSIGAVPASSNGTSFRLIERLQRSPSEQTTTLGPQLGTGTKITTLAATPYLRLRAQIPAGTYTDGANAEFAQNANTVSVFATAAYLGAVPTTWTLDVPDFSSVGYDAAWALKSGAVVSWGVVAASGNVLPFIGGPPVDNAQITAAGAQDSSSAFLASRRLPAIRRPHR